MFDWIYTCIKYYKERKDTQLIIRIHPVEVKVSNILSTRDRVEDFISKNFDSLSNIIILLPTVEVSPYVLMDISSLGLVYTSSTGFEMAL